MSNSDIREVMWSTATPSLFSFLYFLSFSANDNPHTWELVKGKVEESDRKFIDKWTDATILLIDPSWSAPSFVNFQQAKKAFHVGPHREGKERGFSNNPSKNLWTHSLRIHSCEPNFKKHQDQGYPHFPVIVTPEDFFIFTRGFL